MNVPKLRFKEFTDEWQKKTLKSVSSYFKSGKSIKSNDILKNAPYPVYGGNGLRGYTNTFNFDGNASLIGRQGALCGNVTYVKGKNYMTEHAVIVQSNYANYNKFLFYILLSMNLNQYSTQSAQPGLSVNNLLELFNYFPNIQEQEKIAKFLTIVDKKITNLENTITSLEDQKKGFLQQIFSQKLRFKDKNGNNYPNWEKKQLSEYVFIYDGTHQTPKYTNGGIKFVSVENINNLSGTNKFISEKDFLKEFKNIPEKNDILMTRIGDVGTATLITQNEPLAYYVSLALFKQKKSIHMPFLLHYISTIYFQHELWKRTLHIAFPKKINKNEIGKCNLLVPCLEEQTKIADFLSAFDRKLENQKAQLEHWKQIKKGLLQQMFV